MGKRTDNRAPVAGLKRSWIRHTRDWHISGDVGRRSVHTRDWHISGDVGRRSVTGSVARVAETPR